MNAPDQVLFDKIKQLPPQRQEKKGSGLPFLLHSVRIRLLLCRYQPTDM